VGRASSCALSPFGAVAEGADSSKGNGESRCADFRRQPYGVCLRQALPILVYGLTWQHPWFIQAAPEIGPADPPNPLLFGLQLGDSDTQGLLHGSDRRLIFVGLARPEEALEAIFAPTWHNMDVQVRDTLADAVVDGDEGTMGLQAMLDRSRQELGVGHQGCEQSRWQVEQRTVVSFGN
jgi:hypothetical protein